MIAQHDEIHKLNPHISLKTGRAQGFYTEQSLIKTLIEETLALETKKNLYSWIKVERVAYRNT